MPCLYANVIIIVLVEMIKRPTEIISVLNDHQSDREIYVETLHATSLQWCMYKPQLQVNPT